MLLIASLPVPSVPLKLQHYGALQMYHHHYYYRPHRQSKRFHTHVLPGCTTPPYVYRYDNIARVSKQKFLWVGRMSFWSPNQQCQSTEGIVCWK